MSRRLLQQLDDGLIREKVDVVSLESDTVDAIVDDSLKHLNTTAALQPMSAIADDDLQQNVPGWTALDRPIYGASTDDDFEAVERFSSSGCPQDSDLPLSDDAWFDISLIASLRSPDPISPVSVAP